MEIARAIGTNRSFTHSNACFSCPPLLFAVSLFGPAAIFLLFTVSSSPPLSLFLCVISCFCFPSFLLLFLHSLPCSPPLLLLAHLPFHRSPSFSVSLTCPLKFLPSVQLACHLSLYPPHSPTVLPPTPLPIPFNLAWPRIELPKRNSNDSHPSHLNLDSPISRSRLTRIEIVSGQIRIFCPRSG